MSATSGPNIVENGLVFAFDPGDMRSYSSNMFASPTDIFAFTGSAGVNNGTQSRDTSLTSPAGGTPLKMITSGNDPHIGCYNSPAYNAVAAVVGETWTISFYVKSSEPTTGEVLTFAANSSGAAWTGSSWFQLTSKTYNISTDWTRVEHSITLTNSDTSFLQFRLDGTTTTYINPISIWWDGMQIEKTSTSTDFNPNYYGNAANDISENRYLLTVNSTPFYSSNNNGVLVFDGINDYIRNSDTSLTVANGLFANTGVSWSASAWFKFPISPTQIRDNNVGGGNCSFSIIGKSGGIATGAMFAIFVGGASTAFGTFPNKCVSAIRGVNTAISDLDVNTNTWNNVVVTWDGTSAKGYFNDSSPASLTVGTAAAQSVNIDIGTTASANGVDSLHNFEGSIGSVHIYNKALSQSEVTQNFNALRGRFGV